MLDLVIVGAGGFGRELHAMLFDVYSPDEYRFKGFLANELSAQAESLGPLLGTPEDYEPAPADRLLLAIGDIKARQATTESLESRGGQFATFVHPLAFVASTASIASGAVIYPFATVSNAARIAPQVHLNYYACVGHDAEVGRGCLMAPYATINGFCVLEEFVYLSTHATVVVAKRVGTRSKVSANSAVMQDVPPRSMVFGVPGRVTRLVGA